MREWSFENAKIIEAEHDHCLHKFNVYDADGWFLGSIYPDTIEQMEADMKALDSGSNPINDGWEDGNGHVCCADGWNEVVKYDVYHERMEVGYKKFVGEYEHGTLASATIPNNNSYCPELLGQYDSEAEAIASIEGETSRSWEERGKLGTLIFAEECWVEKATYAIDENGELEYVSGGDIVYLAPPEKNGYRVTYQWGKRGEWSDYFYFDTFEEAQADVEKEKENLDEDYNGASDLEAYKIIDCLGNIIDEGWGLMNITEIRAIRYELGMTRKAFCELMFDIPYRTEQDWELDKSTPPDYVVELIKFRADKYLEENK